MAVLMYIHAGNFQGIQFSFDRQSLLVCEFNITFTDVCIDAYYALYNHAYFVGLSFCS